MHIVSDLFTQIRNATKVNLSELTLPHSNLKESIVKILLQEGYINTYKVVEEKNNKKLLKIGLKYKNNDSVIEEIKVVSKPGNRKYIKKKNIHKVLNGFGISIISTSSGVITGKQARSLNVGGELLGIVS